MMKHGSHDEVINVLGVDILVPIPLDLELGDAHMVIIQVLTKCADTYPVEIAIFIRCTEIVETITIYIEEYRRALKGGS